MLGEESTPSRQNGQKEMEGLSQARCGWTVLGESGRGKWPGQVGGARPGIAKPYKPCQVFELGLERFLFTGWYQIWIEVK